MLRKLFVSFILLLNLNLAVLAESTIVSFDLDETLIASDKLRDKDVKKAKELGFEVRTTKKGQDYIVRPGALDLLEYAQGQGFELMLFSHNTRKYADDILQDSGLAKYFTIIKSHEDVIKKENRDYKKYPYHRNISYPQDSFFKAYTVGLYQGLIVRGFSRLRGNQNIHAYLPCTHCAKYPPMFGVRVHIDNSRQHVDKPLDFVGIEVVDFEGDKLEPQNKNGQYLWAQALKDDLNYLKQNGWISLYKRNYNKEPVTASKTVN